jgi:ATP-dependent metalloprotease
MVDHMLFSPPFFHKNNMCLVFTTGGFLRNLHERYRSSYVGSFTRKIRDFDSPSEASLLKEIYRSDPERVIQIFESQPSLHSNASALSEYIKALVSVDRLEESPLLKTLQRGIFGHHSYVQNP